ncbi:MAG: hypothetical protein ABI343_07330 [Burkholderiaceae bacterium]
MTLTPLIAVHMSAAVGALVLGPIALWARKGARQRPRLHRAFGYGFGRAKSRMKLPQRYLGQWLLEQWRGMV